MSDRPVVPTPPVAAADAEFLRWLARLCERPPSPAPSPGSVGPFSLGRPLGVGGTGEVWEALDTRTGRRVALKLLSSELLEDRRASRRFLAEGDTLSTLQHRGIVRVLDVGTFDGRPAVVLEAVDGVTLDRVLRAAATPHGAAELRGLAPRRQRRGGTGRPTDAWVLRWVSEVAAALGYAHARGVLHRDVTPRNVLVDADGRAKLIDFGIARSAGTSILTVTGECVGTPGYMAPEAWVGETVVASDVYSLGIVLFEALTGRRPFDGVTGPATATSVAPALRTLRPDLDPPIEWVVQRALAPDVQNRYPTADAFHDDLERVRTGRRTAARPPPLRERLRAFGRAHPRLSRVGGWTASAVLAGSLALAAVALLRDPDPASVRRAAEQVARDRALEQIDLMISRLDAVGRGAWRLESPLAAAVRAHPTEETARRLARPIATATHASVAARRKAAQLASGEADLSPAVERFVATGQAITDDDRAEVARIEHAIAARLLVSPSKVWRRVIDDARAVGAVGATDVVCRLLRDLPWDADTTDMVAAYLRVEADEFYATPAGAALARHVRQSSRAAEVLRDGVLRFGPDGAFWRAAVRDDAESAEWLPATPPDGQRSSPAPAARAVGGARADPTGARVIDAAFIDGWLGLGTPADAVHPDRDDLADARAEALRRPRVAATWRSYGELLYLRGAPETAYLALCAASAVDPRDPDTWSLRAQAARLAGAVDLAVECQREAVRLDPARREFRAVLGLFLADAGEPTEGLRCAQQALEGDDPPPVAWLYAAMVQLARGDVLAAEAAARRASAVDPGASEPLHVLGCALRRLGRYDDAATAEEEAVRRAPTYILGWMGLGLSQLERANAAARRRDSLAVKATLVAAEAILSHAIRLDPKLPHGWVNRGVARLAARRYTDARSDFAAAALRMPSLPESHLGAALASAGAGDEAAALRSVDEFERFAREDDPARDTLRTLVRARLAAGGR